MAVLTKLHNPFFLLTIWFCIIKNKGAFKRSVGIFFITQLCLIYPPSRLYKILRLKHKFYLMVLNAHY